MAGVAVEDRNKFVEHSKSLLITKKVFSLEVTSVVKALAGVSAEDLDSVVKASAPLITLLLDAKEGDYDGYCSQAIQKDDCSQRIQKIVSALTGVEVKDRDAFVNQWKSLITRDMSISAIEVGVIDTVASVSAEHRGEFVNHCNSLRMTGMNSDELVEMFITEGEKFKSSLVRPIA